MKRIKALKKIVLFAIIMGLYITTSSAELITIPACEDVYLQTSTQFKAIHYYYSPFLKFDISVVPAGKQIDSVFLRIIAYGVNLNNLPSGGIEFWNVNNQDWAEDSTVELWDCPISDTIIIDSEFGRKVGESFSVDLKPLFLRDYDSSHTYCSIAMGDDYWLSGPLILEEDSHDSSDSLALGDDHVGLLFHPHEVSPDSAPTLFVYYGESSVEEEKFRFESLELKASPNPFTQRTVIRYSLTENQDKYTNVKLTITDLSGRVVREIPINDLRLPINEITWDAQDQSGNPVSGGIYFYTFTSDNYKKTKKMCLMR